MQNTVAISRQRSLLLRSSKANKGLEEEGIWQGSGSRIGKQEEISLSLEI